MTHLFFSLTLGLYCCATAAYLACLWRTSPTLTKWATRLLATGCIAHILSTVHRGDLEVSVSTDGTCPGFAAVVRDLLATVIGEEYGSILATLALEREKLLTEGNCSTYNNQILRSRARELINEFTERKERVP